MTTQLHLINIIIIINIHRYGAETEHQVNLIMHVVRIFVCCVYSTVKPLWWQELPKIIGQYLYIITYILRVLGGTVKVLCYKSEGRWFDPSWCHLNFSLT